MTLEGFEDLIPIKIRSGIKPGEEVWNGYPGQYCIAPEEPGRYSLYQLVDPDTNRHMDFVFERSE